MRAELASLEAKIQYRFSDPGRLRRALTHSSHANEARSTPDSPREDNEQLEFLGDAILGFLISEALVARFPDSREGDLSRLKAHLVSATHLHGVARRLDLGEFLELGRSEEMGGGRTKKTLLADALEALIAALYLDGGIATVRRFVETYVLDAPAEIEEAEAAGMPAVLSNYKGALQELAKSRKLPLPRYVMMREQGPEHAKIFTVEARVGPGWTAQAEGRTKKLAAQRAARTVYERLLAAQAPSNPPPSPIPSPQGTGL